MIKLIDERVPSKRVHLVGLSLGADLALAMTQIAPDFIDHVIVSAEPSPIETLPHNEANFPFLPFIRGRKDLPQNAEKVATEHSSNFIMLKSSLKQCPSKIG